MTEKSILDVRLAEIDRRLRSIQSGLVSAATEASGAARDERAAEPPVVVPEAAPVPKRLSDAAGQEFAPAPPQHEASRLVARLTGLVEAHERLLASAHELVNGLPAADAGSMLSVSAGPFADTEALHRFERALQTLPEVQRVSVREYEGTDRAIIDVHLAQPNP